MSCSEARALAVLLGRSFVVAHRPAAAGFRIERGGSGWPRFIVRSNDGSARGGSRTAAECDRSPGLEAQSPGLHNQLAAQRSRSAAVASTSAHASQTATVDKPNAPIAPTAPVASDLVRFPRAESRRALHRDADSHELAARRAAPSVEAAGRRGLRVVCRRRWPRVHDRAAAQSGSGRRLRCADRTRALDERVERELRRIDGRRRSARDADVSRRAHLRAWRRRGAARARRGEGHARVAAQHPFR